MLRKLRGECVDVEQCIILTVIDKQRHRCAVCVQYLQIKIIVTDAAEHVELSAELQQRVGINGDCEQRDARKRNTQTNI